MPEIIPFIFFFLDEKETGQICKSIFEPGCAVALDEKISKKSLRRSAEKIVVRTVSPKSVALLPTYAVIAKKQFSQFDKSSIKLWDN